MRVRGREQNRLSLYAEGLPQPIAHSVGDGTGYAYEIDRDQCQTASLWVLDHQSLGPQVMQHAFGWSIPRRVSGHPHRFFGSDNNLRGSGLPVGSMSIDREATDPE